MFAAFSIDRHSDSYRSLTLIVSLPSSLSSYCFPSYAQNDPSPSKVVGVFGLSMYTDEKELKHIFITFGPIKEVQVIYDRQVRKVLCIFSLVHIQMSSS